MLRKEKEIKRIKLRPTRTGNRGLTMKFIFSQLSLNRLPYLLGFCIILVFLLNPYLGVNTQEYAIGELVQRNIKAPFTMSVVDKESTEKEQLAAESFVLPVYDYDNYDDQNFSDSSYYKRIKEAFSLMRTKYIKAGASGAIRVELSNYELKLLKKEFDGHLGIELPMKVFTLLSGTSFKQTFESRIIWLMKNIVKHKIIAKKDFDNIDMDKGIILNYLRGKSDYQVPFKNFDIVITVEKAHELIKKNISQIFLRYGKTNKKLLASFFQKMLSPTLTFNREKTESLIAEARESVKPVVINIKKGEMIIRDGTFISKRELMILNAIKEKSGKRSSFTYLIGAFILIFLSYLSICSFSSRFIKKFRHNDRDLLVMGVSIILILLFFKWYGNLIPSFLDKGNLPISSWIYLFPFAMGAMIVRLLFNSETSIVYAFFLSLLCGLFLEKNLFFTMYVFFSSIIAAGMVGYAQDRAVLLKAGLKTGLFNVLFVVVINLLATVSEAISFMDIFYGSLAGFAGGILGALLTYGVIPVLEWALKYSTDIRLLELANLNHPLLRELMVQCPGTYHHSMIVGNLVEAAAEAIHANSLLTRVAAYYHDIGKLRKPQYFIENMRGKENKHDKLTPNMSALILISHIKDGVELAKEYNLGSGICDIIQQHQGTTLIKFFYHKAREQADTKKPVEEKDFRYNGPKPQTKEAALVMIADQVEATVRALSEPSHSRIKGSVQTTIDNLFADGQFDECDLTLRDLNTIAESFIRVLTGMQHQRIDYPMASKGSEKNENIDKAREEASRDKNKTNKITSTHGFRYT